MNTAATLLHEASRWRLRITARDGKLIVTPARNCPPEFAKLLREHKAELLDLLQAQVEGLKPDEGPWLHIAKQILCGEWDDRCDVSTRESLTIGLRSIQHPICKSALARLGAEPKGQR